MQNSRAVLLTHAPSFLPTHIIVVNFDARLQDAIDEMAVFLPNLGVTILHVHRDEGASVRLTELNEAQMIRMLPDLASFDLDDPFPWADATYRYYRPSILQAIRQATKSWSDEFAQDRTVMLFIGAPRTPLEAVLLGELPLDVEAFFFRRTSALPLVLRFLIAQRKPFATEEDLSLARVFADLEQSYFALPDFPTPFETEGWMGTPSGNLFDTTVWIDGEEGGEIVHFLRAVLRLHGHENEKLARNRPPQKSSERAEPTSLDAALRLDAEQRLVDWLSMCASQFVPRLWTHGLPALGAALDMEHDKRREKDPFASIGKYERELSWDSNLLVQTYLSQLDHPRQAHDDLTQADFPYRITEDDSASKLEMAKYLADLGEFARSASLAEELLEDDPNHRILTRMLGTNLYVAGQRERGGQALQRCIHLTELDPLLSEAERADEIATLYHLMQDYKAAISGYERAIEADPLNSHAYQGLVLIHRGLGESALADYWLEAARRRDLALPLVTGEDHLEQAFEEERPMDFAASDDTERARERRSRWWSFLRR